MTENERNRDQCLQVRNGKAIRIWLPTNGTISFEREKELFDMISEKGYQAYGARFPELREPSLFVGTSVYSGDEIDGWLKEVRKEPTPKTH
jgi:hypothetical protein